MDMAQSTHTVSGDVDLTMDERRVVARYVVWHAEDVLPFFEQAVPDDSRPGAAIGDALERSRQCAAPVLIDVLRRYPPATRGSNRVAQLMSALDDSLRRAAERSPGHTALSRADARSGERAS